MPKTTKTFRSTSTTHNQQEGFLNMVKATASAMGANYMPNGDASDSYYILTDVIGYPGWCLTMKIKDQNYFTVGIATASGTPNYESDTNVLTVDIQSSASYFPDYNPVTCTVIYDNSKDIVGISAHVGVEEDGSDIVSSGKLITFKAFFAKDMNDAVLCGLGVSHISGIRTIDNKAEINNAESQYFTDISLSTVLHLTKMVNYLSTGYPEMKSAYVSVVRPKHSANVEHNKAFYAAGARWALPGFYPEKISGGNAKALYEPFEPFIKY